MVFDRDLATKRFQWKLVGGMYYVGPSARRDISGVPVVGKLAIETWPAIAHRRPLLKAQARELGKDTFIPTLASLLLALTVLLGGAAIGQTPTTIPILPSR